MKFPRDPKYIKISFYVIFTLVVFYIFKVLIDGIALAFQNIGKISAGLGGFFSSLLSALAPFFIGVVIAYLLEPLVGFFQKKYDLFRTNVLEPYFHRFKWYKKRKARIQSHKQSHKRNELHKKRIAGATLTYMAIILFLGFSILIFILRIGNVNAGQFSHELAQTITSTANDFTDLYTALQIKLEEWGILEYLSKYLAQMLKTLSSLVEKIAAGLVNMVSSAGGGLATFGIGVIVAFYFMVDKEAIHAKLIEIMDVFIPSKPNRIVKNLLGDLHGIFSGYIQGQLTDAFIMALLMSVWLSLIGVKFAVIIGVFSGFSNIIPYFGAFIGFALSVLVALISGEPMTALYAAAGIIVLQILDGIFIAPRVVGKSVELSPVLVILSLTVAGNLFGLAGMILAVPVCAVIKMLLSRFVERQRSKNEAN